MYSEFQKRYGAQRARISKKVHKTHLGVNVINFAFSFLVTGCANFELVGNGFCNDETNNPDCNYDGGDCCIMDANTDAFVGDGFCNDETNIAECYYDGGDCCGN